MSSPYPFRMEPNAFESLVVYSQSGATLGTCIATAVARWNRGGYPINPGVHEGLPIFGDEKTFVDNGYGMRVPVTLYIGLLVERQLYYGQYPIKRISGFKDEIANHVITNAFEIGLLYPDEVERSWRKIGSVEEAPVPRFSGSSALSRGPSKSRSTRRRSP